MSFYTTHERVSDEEMNEIKKLEDELWTAVYSKIPGVRDIAKKGDYMSKKNQIRELYLEYFLENQHIIHIEQCKNKFL